MTQNVKINAVQRPIASVDTMLDNGILDPKRPIPTPLIFTGTDADDFVPGGDGNNMYNGGAGNDTLYGGYDFDTLVGGEGSDDLDGNDDDDSLDGQDGEDTLEGGDGNDQLYGGAGNDLLYGGAGSDTLYGGEGDDILAGQQGNDVMVGGGGNDTFVVNSAGDVVSESIGEGRDTVISLISYDLGEDLEILILTGTGNMTGNGNGSHNAITGNTGNDTLSGGGGNDTIARLLATKLSVVFNQRVIVENKPGANTIIGNDMVAKAPPDGHTLIVNGTGFITNPSFYAKMPFDSLKDFTPVAFIAFTELALVVNTALPAQSVKEIIALAKAKPATLNFGNTGLGGSEHLAGVLFGQLGGVDIGSIPYKGAAAAITDLLGGQVQLMITALAAVKPHIQSGQLRLVAMADTGRSPQYPNVPTVVESGLAGFQTAMWYGVMAPAGMPEGVLKKLNHFT
jgi:tripartite-type tricarboxylate transporter receptor subunit TctC